MTPGSYVHENPALVEAGAIRDLIVGYQDVISLPDVDRGLAALDSLLARLEAAERERDHWIVETKKADRRLEAAERERDEAQKKLAWYERTRWVSRLKEERDRAEAAEAENKRLREALVRCRRWLNENPDAAPLDLFGQVTAALAARTEEQA